VSLVERRGGLTAADPCSCPCLVYQDRNERSWRAARAGSVCGEARRLDRSGATADRHPRARTPAMRTTSRWPSSLRSSRNWATYSWALARKAVAIAADLVPSDLDERHRDLSLPLCGDIDEPGGDAGRGCVRRRSRSTAGLGATHAWPSITAGTQLNLDKSATLGGGITYRRGVRGAAASRVEAAREGFTQRRSEAPQDPDALETTFSRLRGWARTGARLEHGRTTDAIHRRRSDTHAGANGWLSRGERRSRASCRARNTALDEDPKSEP
jgi:hypothetical protein